MYRKIYFKPVDGKSSSDIHIKLNDCQKLLNSYIHRVIGADNEYHDSFSEYNISQLQGTKLDVKTGELYIPEGEQAYITVSVFSAEENKEHSFIDVLKNGLYNKNVEFCGLTFDRIETYMFPVNKRFDVVVTTSPIILVDNNRKISIDNPEYLQKLENHCIQKLAHHGISDDTFKLFIRDPKRAKVRKKMVGDVFNICTVISMYVYGKPETRRAMYQLGFGGSTGSGFGSVKLFE